MKRTSPKNIAWYVANKSLPYASTLVGVGAAKEVSEGVLESIASGVTFPYDLLIGGSFAAEAGEAMFKVGASMIEHPVETASVLLGSYALGKLASWYGETKRLKQVYGQKR